MTGTTATRSDRRERTFFGQPFELSTLFGVETWERFSFYGMQGILLIYLYYAADRGGLGIPQVVASGVVGAYGGSVYLSTVAGAWIADRLAGAERTLFASAAVVMAGHVSLALVPGVPGVVLGLILIAVGSGGVKANATTIVGTLYAEGDTRRAAGFSLYYLGVNLGAFFGPLLTGLLQSAAGFHVGFGLAAVGMAAGLVQYAVRRRNLPDVAREVPNPLPRARMPLVGGIAGAGVVVVVVAVATGLLTAADLALVVTVVVVLAAIAYFAVLLRATAGDERSRVLGFLPLFVVNAVFWSLYQQQFNVVTVYTDERLNRHVLGFEVPVPWSQSINPIMIILLSGVFAALWTRLGDRQPATPTKFGVAAAVMGGAFLLFLPFAGTGPHGTPYLALVAILLVFTVAELLISPTGQSATTLLAPQRFRTQMVALYFLSVALGTSLSGVLAPLYSARTEVPYFALVGGAAVVVGVLFLLAVRPVLRLMRGVR